MDLRPWSPRLYSDEAMLREIVDRESADVGREDNSEEGEGEEEEEDEGAEVELVEGGTTGEVVVATSTGLSSPAAPSPSLAYAIHRGPSAQTPHSLAADLSEYSRSKRSSAALDDSGER